METSVKQITKFTPRRKYNLHFIDSHAMLATALLALTCHLGFTGTRPCTMSSKMTLGTDCVNTPGGICEHLDGRQLVHGKRWRVVSPIRHNQEPYDWEVQITDEGTLGMLLIYSGDDPSCPFSTCMVAPTLLPNYIGLKRNNFQAEWRDNNIHYVSKDVCIMQNEWIVPRSKAGDFASRYWLDKHFEPMCCVRSQNLPLSRLQAMKLLLAAV